MCRCVISGLRYLFILHQDWLDSHWPEPRKLRQAGLASVFGLLFLQISINTVTFMLLAKPYGWPQKSFFQSVPGPIQTTIILICLFVFLLPVKISIVFYLLLLKQRKTFETKNKVGIIETKTSISGNCATLGLDKTSTDQVQGSVLGTGLSDAGMNLLVSTDPSSKSNSSRSSSPEVQSRDSNPGTEDLKSIGSDRDILERRIQVNVAPDCNEGAVADEPEGHDHEDVLARAGAVNGPKEWVEGPVDQSPDCSESESSDSGHRSVAKSPDAVNQTATQLVGAFCEGLLSKTNSIDVQQSQLQQEQQQQKPQQPQQLDNQEVERQQQHPRQHQPFLVSSKEYDRDEKLADEEDFRERNPGDVQMSSKADQSCTKVVDDRGHSGQAVYAKPRKASSLSQLFSTRADLSLNSHDVQGFDFRKTRRSLSLDARLTVGRDPKNCWLGFDSRSLDLVRAKEESPGSQTQPRGVAQITKRVHFESDFESRLRLTSVAELFKQEVDARTQSNSDSLDDISQARSQAEKLSAMR